MSFAKKFLLAFESSGRRIFRKKTTHFSSRSTFSKMAMSMEARTKIFIGPRNVYTFWLTKEEKINKLFRNLSFFLSLSLLTDYCVNYIHIHFFLCFFYLLDKHFSHTHRDIEISFLFPHILFELVFIRIHSNCPRISFKALGQIELVVLSARLMMQLLVFPPTLTN